MPSSAPSGLFATGAAGLEIVLTTLLLNIRHLLYGVSLGRRFTLSPRQRPAAAYFLTDEAFGVAVASEERTFSFLLGVELSLFAMWNLATFAGYLLGATIPDPTRARRRLHLPARLRGAPRAARADRVELVVAVASGALALWAREVAARRPSDPLTGIAGSLLGAALTRGQPADRSIDPGDAAREVA